ncbi:response regulator transcription factor [Cohnella lupini]|uniref:Two-component system response regulator YesN n=1 Tax=Cohnella lupini TaxID=1294267 RepID=A0A3D9IF33_9BACL|nr:response regulator transcription factor [Cohnella lupini]RED60358.1 two-component system response regulator YesN [Cohnella lupini]
MYNVLLVDDEPTIREGLRTLIPWEDMGFRVMDTAANGQEALQKCELQKPDLMIADIRMPGMNGLELVKHIRDLGQELHVLILSGYADFEYAKQAIAHRIDGYLLKPVDEDELTNYLRVLHAQLDEAESKKQERSDEGTMERSIQALLTEASGLDMSTSRIEDLNWEEYEVVLVKPLTNEAAFAPHMLIKQKLEKHFDQCQRGIAFAMDPYIGVLVKNGVGDEWNQRTIYKKIEQACQEYSSEFSASAGGAVRSWTDVVVSYQKAISRMKNRFFHEETSLIMADIDPDRTSDREHQALESLLSDAIISLYLAMEVGNFEAGMNVIREMAETLKREGYAEEEFKNAHVQLLTSVFDKFSHRHNGFQSMEIRGAFIDLHKERSYGSVLDKVNHIVRTISDAFGHLGKDKLIKRMTDLIHRNFNENLKLEKLAELYNYNSAYLGKLFKQATGAHFNTYLDNVRIEQAKLLLEQGDKVYEVATKVGYANVDYFHAKFRKYVGSSPSGYKKK